MIISRNGIRPSVSCTSKLAPSAQVIGNVVIGEHCYIDHNVVIESSGSPITIGDETIIFSNTVIRSTGGTSRPSFPVSIGCRTLISPLCALVGCSIGSNCYIATSAMVFHGALISDNCRIAAGAIVHLKTYLPEGTHIALRHIAVPSIDGFLVTDDIKQARVEIAKADFFKTVFEESFEDRDLHSKLMVRLFEEVSGWDDVISN